jgi:hypothetical protein
MIAEKAEVIAGFFSKPPSALQQIPTKGGESIQTLVHAAVSQNLYQVGFGLMFLRCQVDKVRRQRVIGKA